jgi:hypothetical protein
LRLTEVEGDSTRVNLFAWDAASKTWSRSTGDGQRTQTVTEEILGGNRVKTDTTRDAEGRIASRVRTTYHTFPWGVEVVERLEDQDGVPRKSTTVYEATPGDPGYGKPRSRTTPDGSWVRYSYGAGGHIVREVRPWLDGPEDSRDDASRVTEYNFTPVDPRDAGDSADSGFGRPRTVTEKVLGIVVSRTYSAFFPVAETGDHVAITERCGNPSAAYGDPANERTTTTYLAVGTKVAGSGRIRSTRYPDGRTEVHEYEFGTCTAGAGKSGEPGRGRICARA